MIPDGIYDNKAQGRREWYENGIIWQWVTAQMVNSIHLFQTKHKYKKPVEKFGHYPPPPQG